MFDFESGSRLKTIGQRAFHAAGLRDFTLPENLETIGELSFINARFTFQFDRPGTLTIPAKVSKIGIFNHQWSVKD